MEALFHLLYKFSPWLYGPPTFRHLSPWPKLLNTSSGVLNPLTHPLGTPSGKGRELRDYMSDTAYLTYFCLHLANSSSVILVLGTCNMRFFLECVVVLDELIANYLIWRNTMGGMCFEIRQIEGSNVNLQLLALWPWILFFKKPFWILDYTYVHVCRVTGIR